jgi:hypothetical protein
MSDEIPSVLVALSERERFTLAVFFSGTYKPKNKAERKAMKLAFKRLRLDEIIARMRKPEGIKPTMLSDAPVAVPLNEETIAWAAANLNKTQSETADSLILSDVEDRFDEVQAGTYVLPDSAKPKASLTSVPSETPPAS